MSVTVPTTTSTTVPSTTSTTVPSTTSTTVLSTILTTIPSTSVTTPSSLTSTDEFVLKDLFNLIPSETGNMFQTEPLVSLIPFGMSSISKASTSLKNLMKVLPDALSNMEISIKHDIAKVNWVISNTCHKIIGEANKPESFSYYTPERFNTTCNYVNKVAGNILLEPDDPSFTQYYVDKFTRSINAVQEISDVYFSV